MISTLRVQTLETESLIEKIKAEIKSARRQKPSGRSLRGLKGWPNARAAGEFGHDPISDVHQRLIASPAGQFFQSTNVCFSNRRVGVKHFQTIHQCGVDVARGLVLLFGIGTGALPSWDSRTRRNNLLVGLAVEERRVQADMRTHLIHRPARDIFPPLGETLSFLLSGLILNGFHAAATACSRVHRNSVPSTQIRCMITASRRASATIAFFIPRRLAICMAQALSQDHFFERSML